jgi:hypothetical protein
VNADQAVVADQIVSEAKETIATNLLTTGTDKPIGIIEPKQNEAMPVEGEGRRQNEQQPHAQAHAAPRCTARSKRTGQPCRSPAVRGWKVCRMHGARSGAPEGERNGNYHHGARTKATVELWHFIKSLR